MTERRVTRAVVLAAGTGSRLGEGGDSTPKPLRPAASVPLLVRVLRSLEVAGIREAVVVVGHQADAIRRALVAEPSLGLELTFVNNERYLAKNGVSLLAAADLVDRECLLTMSDHLYSPELVRRLLAAELPAGACALGVDYDIERCFDLDDATKVGVKAGKIADISKELERYDAIDTGVFRIGPALIEELARLDDQHGDCSLSDGVRALAARGAFHAVDVGDVRWIDVDTPAALERAEAMLRVFGDHLGDEPGAGAPQVIDADGMELFSPTWVRAAKPYNEDHFAVAEKTGVARMMSNESAVAPSPRVIEAIVQAATRGHLYPSGGAELRAKLGSREKLGGDNVLLGAGSTEIIDVIIRTFVAAGEEVLLSVPTFSMYEARTRVCGGIPVLVTMTEDHQHDMLGLLRAVTERTKVIFLCTPNNPTGNRIPEVDMRRLLRLGLPTVIDEAYYELGDGPSLSHLISEYPNAIVIRTFSKAFGLAGLRVGYALGHASVIKLLARVKVPWNLPAVSIAAASAALDDVAEFESRVAELKTAREELGRSLSRIPGVVAIPSEGNFILVDISHTRVGADGMVAALLGEGVLIRSLGSHHAERSYVRVTVGTREQNARCVAAFERVVGRRVPRDAGVPAFIGGDAE
ncbi:MAG: histidinol-phosphate transaminase [Myxococcales bacterium]|nr:histidinol-phosphate transaminase [Myxococcales bacterium]